VGRDSYRDVPVQLTGTSPVAIGHGRLKSGTVIVKGKEIGAPRFEQVAIDGEPVKLACDQLIPDSMVVASDTSLGKIYTENLDYSADYPAGKLLRLADGAIPEAASVAVWYFCYRLYSEGIDYSINLTRGTIRRLAGGDIEDGQVVFIDYQTQAGFFTDNQITQAIGEADDRLRLIVDPQQLDETNQSLVVAESYLAIAILCRIKAVSSLEPASGQDGRQAEGWLQLAECYERDGLRLAGRFARAGTGLSGPTAVRGGGKA
jgi:hypothetical protein